MPRATKVASKTGNKPVSERTNPPSGKSEKMQQRERPHASSDDGDELGAAELAPRVADSLRQLVVSETGQRPAMRGTRLLDVIHYACS
jgi:hypothetical protein